MQCLTVYERFSKIVDLYKMVFGELWRFTQLFFIFVLFFAILNYLARVEVATDDYPNLPEMVRYIINTWRTSIGDIQLPKYTHWTHFGERGENYVNPYRFMLILIWVIWFVTQFINFIIMLNFLIVMISSAYSLVMSKQSYSIYLNKCKLNEKYINSLNNKFASGVHSCFPKRF